jgi:hypothetical protein
MIIMGKNMERSMVRARTRQEIAGEYGIDRKTFYQWLKRARLNVPGGLICPSLLEEIYNTFGNPHSKKSK